MVFSNECNYAHTKMSERNRMDSTRGIREIIKINDKNRILKAARKKKQ